jgi:hypothetical protein
MFEVQLSLAKPSHSSTVTHLRFWDLVVLLMIHPDQTNLSCAVPLKAVNIIENHINRFIIFLIFFHTISISMEEREGFEPSIPIARNNGFQVRRIRPLCHLSSNILYTNQTNSIVRKHFIEKTGAPERSRTTNLQIRSLTLYPIELRARISSWRRERDSNPRVRYSQTLA